VSAEFEEYLAHEGVLRKSGRYPWGSGENPHQRNKSFLDYVDKLKRDGLSETEIASGMGITTTQLRAAKAIAKNETRKADQARALQLKERGLSNVAIGEQLGRNESSVRALLAESARDKAAVLGSTADFLKTQVAEKGYLDVGLGVEAHLGISKEKLSTAVAMLKEEGYEVHKVKKPQLGTGKDTEYKVLAPPGTTWADVKNNTDKIGTVTGYSEDGGRSYLGLQKPRDISSDRLAIRYAEHGGTDADGVMYIRPGVDDLSLGGAKYAQVRISVDGTHYLKGMAMYKDDLPDGVDIMFNTNKSDTGNKLDALKKQKDDPDNPFGATVRQREYIDSSGKKQLSAINIVNEEGRWDDWSKSLSSQMLSKQPVALAKRQLELTYGQKQAQFDEIMSLTNPVVKKKLLESYADDVDSSSVHLKAAALPRQATKVILPMNSMRETEIYAPTYRDGEKVVLIRYPHGGTFEIPELTVNNRNPTARKMLGAVTDAVGINAKVAERLSGADFDGDTVIVIPNDKRYVKTSPPLEGLKGFDPKNQYPYREGMKVMGSKGGGNTQTEMGKVSNLITDMTIGGANHSELARAVRHSMVVIDAEKHKLDYKQSEADNNIKELKAKYQGGANKGAATLISRSTSDIRIAERKARPAAEGGPIDRVTGKKVYVPTGATYVKKNKDGEVIDPKAPRLTKSKRGAEVDDAHVLSSGSPIEQVYADHSNRLKRLANDARKASLETTPIPYSPSARTAYAKEVAQLDAKLNVALKNKPMERQAQLIGNAIVSAKRQSNPDLEPSELKRLKGQALAEARTRTGAQKQRIEFTPKEWEAVQAGAISPSKLNQILNNADLDQVKQLAMPRQATVMTPAALTLARSRIAAGYTQAEVADMLGVPVSTLNTGLLREDG
jgi:DNA-binding CsgD family transcriptional regulator